MLVMKFGGTSVADAASIQSAAELASKQEEPLVVVTSAMGGVTDQLEKIAAFARLRRKDHVRQLLGEIREAHIDAANGVDEDNGELTALLDEMFKELASLLLGVGLLQELSPRSKDLILSFGERLMAPILSAAIAKQGKPSEAVDARKIIRTDYRYGSASVIMDDSKDQTRRLLLPMCEEKIPVVTGFIGETEDGVTTTLGRGGSDYTASLIGAFLDAREIWLLSDVDGVMTADPKVVPEARVLECITYREAAEMAYFGSKVLHPSTIQPAVEKKIPIRALNAKRPDEKGTLIHDKNGGTFDGVKTVTSISNLALVTIEGSGMQGIAGVGRRVFSSTHRIGVSVLIISQASSEHNISFVVAEADGERVVAELAREFEFELERKRVDKIYMQTSVGVLAIIGEGMKGTPGISQRLFTALGTSRINVLTIAQGSSELNLSVVVEQKDLKRAVGAVHTRFGLTRNTHLFLIGKGLIGRTLVRQLLDSRKKLEEQHGILLQVIGICGREQLLMDPHGLKEEVLEQVAEGGDLIELGGEVRPEDDEILERIAEQQRLDVVLVDVTADDTSLLHLGALQRGFHVVTANKIPLSSPLERYRALRREALTQGCSYHFETTFGAGLPVLHTLQDLLATHDEVISITGCFSGTLGFICSGLQKGYLFSQVVAEAKELGFTEPDPRDDLSGVDVARKALIIAREMGSEMEMADIELESLISPDLMELDDVETFMERLSEMDEPMRKRVAEAQEKGKVLRYVAEITPEKVNVGLREVDAHSPPGQLDGPDNILVYKTERYRQHPLVIRGPGAGGEVTAAGVFGDILKVARKL